MVPTGEQPRGEKRRREACPEYDRMGYRRRDFMEVQTDRGSGSILPQYQELHSPHEEIDTWQAESVDREEKEMERRAIQDTAGEIESIFKTAAEDQTFIDSCYAFYFTHIRRSDTPRGPASLGSQFQRGFERF